MVKDIFYQCGRKVDDTVNQLAAFFPAEESSQSVPVEPTQAQITEKVVEQ
jgi:hypothetical protein